MVNLRLRSRLRTARGRMSVSGWVRLPAAVVRWVLGSEPQRPWFVPSAVGWLKRRIGADWSVLELGAGRSTVWLARRAASVVSFEHDEEWVSSARGALEEAELRNAELRLLPVERFAEEVTALRDGSFDLVIIDFLESPGARRVDSVRASMSKVKPGGYLVLDDSDRPQYAEAYALLRGWPARRFDGVKEGWFQAVETSIFQRPEGGDPSSAAQAEDA